MEALLPANNVSRGRRKKIYQEDRCLEHKAAPAFGGSRDQVIVGVEFLEAGQGSELFHEVCGVQRLCVPRGGRERLARFVDNMATQRATAPPRECHLTTVKLARHYITRVKESVKGNAHLVLKLAGLKQRTREETETLLAPDEVLCRPSEVVVLPKTEDLAHPDKVILEEVTVTSGAARVWRVNNSHGAFRLLPGGSVGTGRQLLTTDFDANSALKDIFKGKRPCRPAGIVIAPWSHYWGKYYDYLMFVAAKVVRAKSALTDHEYAEAVVSYPLLNTAFEREVLHLLGFTDDRIVDSRSVEVRFRTGVFGNTGSWFYPNPTDILHLRKSLLARMTGRTSAAGRIYISRTGWRKILNEREVIAMLQRFNFLIIEDVPRSVADQCAIFSSARVIIGPHGSAFANILWCQPGAHLIELFSPSYIADYFRYMASLLHLTYSALAPGHPSASHYSNADDDITVPMADLQRALELIL